MKYGLLGRRLGHSWSPEIHRLLGNPSYALMEREENELAALFTRTDIGGLNVTIPYKITVLPYLTHVTEKARRIGCVNTVVFQKDGGRLGDNTDYDGFAGTLDRMGINVAGKRALVLGTGATSRTVDAVLSDRGAKEIRKLGRKDLPVDKEAKTSDILINCTPVGMYPDNGESLVDLPAFSNLSAVIDLIYNPHRSALLLEARKLEIPFTDGLPMLVRQAVAASEQFIGRSGEISEEEILRHIRGKTDNVVLIGMPGCGKTTLGKLLAPMLDKNLEDIDQRIEQESGMTIPAIFETQGEAGFRRLEKEVTRRVGKEHNQIIATGGGVVKDPENYGPLAQNGRIYYLDRPIHKLATRGRPLSAGGKERLRKLYEERKEKYRRFSDVVLTDDTLEEMAEKIREDFYAHCHY